MNSEKPPIPDSSPSANPNRDQPSFRNQFNRMNRNTHYKRDFKGATPELAGFIFNVPSEQKKKGEYNEVIDQLKAYAAQHHNDSLKFLIPILEDDQQPPILKPDYRRDYGDSPSKVDELAFVEDVKFWKKATMKLQLASRAMFEIVWGQCSQTMKVK